MAMKRCLLMALMMLTALSLPAQDWAQFSRYEESNRSVTAKPKAVFIGDSITDGWAAKRPEFFSDNNFLGRGISGQVTSQMLVRFRNDVIRHDPEYVVILAGINDIARNNGYISLENIFGNIVSMCEIAVANGIRPVICSLLPAAAFGWRPEIKGAAEDVMQVNAMLREYAKSKRYRYVDYHSVLKDENNGLPKVHADDGIHPNADCYRIMESIVLPYLK